MDNTDSSEPKNFLLGLIFILIAVIIGVAAIGAATEDNAISDLWDDITGGSDNSE